MGNEEQPRKKRRGTRGQRIAVFLGALFLLVVGLAVAAYFGNVNSAFTIALRSRVPLPAVVIGYSDAILLPEIAGNVASVRRFYETQDFGALGVRVDLTTEDGKKRLKLRERELLNKMIEERFIERLARERGIVVSDESVRQGVERKISEYGGQDVVESELKKLYGWSLAEFEEKIVRPSLYEERLATVFDKEIDAVSAGRSRIMEAQAALRAGEKFEDVARRISEGRTANEGGEIGWFATEDLDQDLRKPVALLKEGVASDVIESRLGFHILRVEEVRDEGGQTFYRLRQIFARRVTFGDWLTERMKEVSVLVLLPEYTWDTERAEVKFRDESFKAFEEKLLKDTGGEAVFSL